MYLKKERETVREEQTPLLTLFLKRALTHDI